MVLGEREHAGVLARAVVVDRRGPLAPPPELLRGRGVARLVRAAAEHGLVQPGLGEDPPHGLQVKGLGAVGSGHDGELLLVEAEPLDQPLFDQGQKLDRFGRGANPGPPLRVAVATHHASSFVDHRRGHGMERLDLLAAPHAHTHRVAERSHRRLTSWRP